jgi:hypothetical protein
MTGGLVGCWYEDSAIATKEKEASGKLLLHGSGTEHFTGCIDVDRDGECGSGDPHGTLSFVYTFIGQFDAVTFEEIRGRCHHPIVEGTEDFAGASGVLNFHDDVATGTAPYMGHVKLGQPASPRGAGVATTDAASLGVSSCAGS